MPKYVVVIFRYSCLPVFAWRRVVLRIYDPKQLLRVSCILWCYYSKYYSIILENASLWCFIIIPKQKAKVTSFSEFSVNLNTSFCIFHTVIFLTFHIDVVCGHWFWNALSVFFFFFFIIHLPQFWYILNSHYHIFYLSLLFDL